MDIESQNKILRRRQAIVAAVAALCGIIVILVVPERWVDRLSVLGVLVIFVCLTLAGIAVRFFSRGRKKVKGARR